jgi:hypothetical protein
LAQTVRKRESRTHLIISSDYEIKEALRPDHARAEIVILRHSEMVVTAQISAKRRTQKRRYHKSN